MELTLASLVNGRLAGSRLCYATTIAALLRTGVQNASAAFVIRAREEAIWDGHTRIHNVIMDGQGKVWFTARLPPPGDVLLCKVEGLPDMSIRIT